jgi:hypothetical protein
VNIMSFGWMMLTVMELNNICKIAHMLDGDKLIVTLLISVYNYSVIMVDLHHLTLL